MEQPRYLTDYLLAKPGAVYDFKEEWQWHRYRVGDKLFAALLCPSAQYDPQYAGKRLLNLKCEPLAAELLQKEHPEVLPGFYSDKRSWISVHLDGGLSEAHIKALVDDSYRLVFTKLTKKLQREIAPEL